MNTPPTPPAVSSSLRAELAALGLALAVLAVPGLGLAALAGVRGGGGTDDTPGGPNHPLDLTEGQSFAVDGFDYAEGWSVQADPDTGTAEVIGLRLTNHRDAAARLAANLRLVDGYEVAATIFCKAGDGYDFVPVGVTVDVLCASSDPMPEDYDALDIRDAY